MAATTITNIITNVWWSLWVILVVIVDSMGSMVVKVFAVGCLFDGSDDFSLWWFYMIVVMVVPLWMVVMAVDVLVLLFVVLWVNEVGVVAVDPTGCGVWRSYGCVRLCYGWQ